ncbi:hypothetical protein MQE23_38400 [Streptomyces sp. HP-A2021]|uniref:hypothetical protein n=1 Tax=Streptomyces sp. HP-A2021 TaxID=2927875 RepID=UPI001FB044EA|nr:hypothetical protein [Streptomyces sp. HP-A2021]UOB14577.1 hypothetical protein MQE23_38400 [Streptomyces sp. HP-A2021]
MTWDPLDEEETAIVLGLLAEFLDEEAARPENRDNRALARMRAQVLPDGQSQGAGEVGRQITIGSPIATSGLVWPRLRPRLAATPGCVDRWLDFWDNDDVVVPRQKLADRPLRARSGRRPTPG